MLDGKVIIVTGAASGIGRAASSVFAGHGAIVVMADVDQNGLEATARDLSLPTARHMTTRLDVTEAGAMADLVSQAKAHFDRFDGAFNNAGIEGLKGRLLPTHEYPDEAFDEVIHVNLRGLYLSLKAQVPALLGSGGAIVNTSSVMGWLGSPGMPAYSASKHGVLGLTRTAALEYASAGVRVNAVLPGAIETPMLLERGFKENPEFADMAVSLHPLGRLGKPEEVAQAAAWLLSDHASFVTGHALAVDGGFSAA